MTLSHHNHNTPVIRAVADHLLENASNVISKARLVASNCSESRACLNALSLSSCGLCMDTEIVEVAVGFRVGALFCFSHQCHHCGATVNELATHGLSCHWSEGPYPRPAAINNIIHQSLTSAQVPSQLHVHVDPSGLYRSDGKCSGGFTILPWQDGKQLIWDATCPDNYAPSHLQIAARGAGRWQNRQNGQRTPSMQH